MDPLTSKQFESRLKECELLLDAILEAIGLDKKYTAEKYTLVQPEKEKGEADN